MIKRDKIALLQILSFSKSYVNCTLLDEDITNSDKKPTTQKMKLSIQYFFSKFEQINNKM